MARQILENIFCSRRGRRDHSAYISESLQPLPAIFALLNYMISHKLGLQITIFRYKYTGTSAVKWFRYSMATFKLRAHCKMKKCSPSSELKHFLADKEWGEVGRLHDWLMDDPNKVFIIRKSQSWRTWLCRTQNVFSYVGMHYRLYTNPLLDTCDYNDEETL